jgi:chaperonin GroES
MNIRPLHDRVIIRRIEEEKTTASGLIIPDAAAEKPLEGVIVAIGNGKKNDHGDNIALEVKVSDKVLSS